MRSAWTWTLIAASCLVSKASAELPAPGSTYHILFATSGLLRTTTSTLLPPAALRFNGIAGADWQASNAAFSAGLPDAHAWTDATPIYRAILSMSGDNARDRLSVTAPVINMHGTLLATSHTELFDGNLAAPVGYDEYGNLITSNFDVWSGSTPSGTAGGQSCGSWDVVSNGVTGRIGDAVESSTSWLGAGPTKACNLAARLYALSPALTAPLWGDYDGSGTVDGGDVLQWQRYVGLGPGTGTQLPSAFIAARSFLDGNQVAVVGAADLEVIQQFFGQSLPATTEIPEPSTTLLTLIAAVATRRLAFRRKGNQ